MVQIQELILRVPGLDKEEASALGKEVAQLVAKAVSPDWQGAAIPELTVRIPASATSDKTALAGTIASQIIEQIKWNRF
jgi:hypothetical protein